MASVNSCASNMTCTQHVKAENILAAGVVDADGRYRWCAEDEAWNFGAVVWVDLDPSQRSNTSGPVYRLINTVEAAYAAAAKNEYKIAGMYIDSVANAQNLVNYDPQRIRNAHYPPVDGAQLGLQAGPHEVLEMTRKITSQITANSSGWMAIPITESTIGPADPNQTIVLKVAATRQWQTQTAT